MVNTRSNNQTIIHTSSRVSEHNPNDLIAIFNHLFQNEENTRLVWGGDEPIYLPADEHCNHHRVIFAHGYFASALHEIAHWCIAGTQRRQLVDYGYWYAPDGRNEQQQREFEIVEVKPQAVEWVLAKACDTPFRVSVDNLNGTQTDPRPFKQAVYRQVTRYCEQTIPPRALLLLRDLASFYGTPAVLSEQQFYPQDIGLERGVDE